MKKEILFSAALLTLSSAGAFADNCLSKGTNALGDDYCQFKDGPVTCTLFRRSDSGGMSCTVDKNEAVNFPTSVKKFFLNDFGWISRQPVGSQICYFYSAGVMTGDGIHCFNR